MPGAAKTSEPLLVNWLHKIGDEHGSAYLRSISSSPGAPIERQFSNGYLFGHLLAALSDVLHIKLREGFMQDLRNVDTTTAKIQNFETLAPALKAIGLSLQPSVVDNICTEEKGAAQKLLFAIQERYDAAKDASAFDKTSGSSGSPSRGGFSPSAATRNGGRTNERLSPSQRVRRKLSAEHAAAAAEYRMRKEHSSKQPLSFLQQLLASGLTPKQAAQEAVLEPFDRVRREREARISEEERLEEERKRAEIKQRVVAFQMARQARALDGTAAILSHSAQISRLHNNLAKRDLAVEVTLAQRTAALDILTRNAAGHELRTGVAEFEMLMRRQGMDPYDTSNNNNSNAGAMPLAGTTSGSGAMPGDGSGGEDWPGSAAAAASGHRVGAGNASYPLGSTGHTPAIPPPGAVSTVERTLRRIVPNNGDLVDVLVNNSSGSDSKAATIGGGEGEGDESTLGFFRRLAGTVGSTYNPAEGDAYAASLGPRVREQRSNRRDVETRGRLDAAAQHESREKAERQAADEARLQALLSHAERERLRAAEVHEKRRLKAEREAEVVASVRADDERRTASVSAMMDEDRRRLTAERLEAAAEADAHHEGEGGEEGASAEVAGDAVDVDPAPAYQLDPATAATITSTPMPLEPLQPWGPQFSPIEVYRGHLRHAPAQPGGPLSSAAPASASSSSSSASGQAALPGNSGAVPTAAQEDDEGERLLDSTDSREFSLGLGPWRLPAGATAAVGDVESAVVAQATAVCRGVISPQGRTIHEAAPVPSNNALPLSPRASSAGSAASHASPALLAEAAALPANLPSSCKAPGLPEPEAAVGALKAILKLHQQQSRQAQAISSGATSDGSSGSQEEQWVSAILNALPSFYRGPRLQLATTAATSGSRRRLPGPRLFAIAAPPLPPSLSSPLVEAARGAVLSRLCTRVKGLARVSPAAVVTAALACFEVNLDLLAKGARSLKSAGYAPAVDPFPAPAAKPDAAASEGKEEEHKAAEAAETSAGSTFPSLFATFPSLKQSALEHRQLLTSLGLFDLVMASTEEGEEKATMGKHATSAAQAPAFVLPELSTLAARNGFIALPGHHDSHAGQANEEDGEGLNALFELGALAAAQLLLVHRSIVEPSSAMLPLASVKERTMTPEEKAALEAEAALAAAPPAAGGKAPAANSKEAKAAAEAAAAAAAAKDAADAAAMASCFPLQLQGPINAGSDNEAIASQLWAHADKAKAESLFATGVNAFRDAVREALLKEHAVRASEQASAELSAKLGNAVNSARSAASGSSATSPTATGSANAGAAPAAPAPAAATKGGKPGAKDAAPAEPAPAASPSPAQASNIPPSPPQVDDVSWASLYLTTPASMEVCLPDAAAALLGHATSSVVDRLSQGSLFALALGAVLGRLGSSSGNQQAPSAVLLDTLPSNGRQLLAVEWALKGKLLWQLAPVQSPAKAAAEPSELPGEAPAAGAPVVPRLALAASEAEAPLASSSSTRKSSTPVFVVSEHAPKGWDGRLSTLLAAYTSGSWALPRVGPQAMTEWRRMLNRYEDSLLEAASASSSSNSNSDNKNAQSSASAPNPEFTALQPISAGSISLCLDFGARFAKSLQPLVPAAGLASPKSPAGGPSAAQSGAPSVAASGAASPAAPTSRSRAGSTASASDAAAAAALSSARSGDSVTGGVSPVPAGTKPAGSNNSWTVDLFSGAVLHSSQLDGPSVKLGEALLDTAAAAMVRAKEKAKAAAEGGEGSDAPASAPQSLLSLSGLGLLTDSAAFSALTGCYPSFTLMRSFSSAVSPGLAGGLLANAAIDAGATDGSRAASAAPPADPKAKGKPDPKAAANATPVPAPAAPPPGSSPEEAAANVMAWVTAGAGVGTVTVGALDIDAAAPGAGAEAKEDVGSATLFPVRQLLLACASVEVYLEKAAEEFAKAQRAAAAAAFSSARAPGISTVTEGAAAGGKEGEGQEEAFLGLVDSQEGSLDAAADELEDAAGDDDADDDFVFLLSSPSAASSAFVDTFRHALARGMEFDSPKELSSLLALYAGCKESRAAVTGLIMRSLRVVQARVRARCRAFARGLFRILHESSPSRRASEGDHTHPWRLIKGQTLESILGAAVQSADAESMKQQRAARNIASSGGAAASPSHASQSQALTPSKGRTSLSLTAGSAAKQQLGSPTSTLRSTGAASLASPYGGKGGFSATGASSTITGSHAATALVPASSNPTGSNQPPTLYLTADGIISPVLAGIYARLYRTAQDPTQAFSDEDAHMLKVRVGDAGADVWAQAEVVRAAAREYLNQGYLVEREWADALASSCLQALGRALVVTSARGLKDDAAFLSASEKAVSSRLQSWYSGQVFAGLQAASFAPNYSGQYYQLHRTAQSASTPTSPTSAVGAPQVFSGPSPVPASPRGGSPSSSASNRQQRPSMFAGIGANASKPDPSQLVLWPASASTRDSREAAAVRALLHGGELSNALSLATEGVVANCDALSGSGEPADEEAANAGGAPAALQLTESVFVHAARALGDYCDRLSVKANGLPSLAASLFVLRGSLSVVKQAASATLALQGLERWIVDCVEGTSEVCRGHLRTWLSARDASVFAATQRLTEAVDYLAKSRLAAIISAAVRDDDNAAGPASPSKASSSLVAKRSSTASTAASRAIMLGKSPLVAPVLGLQPSDFAISVSDSQTVLYAHYGPLGAPEDPEPAYAPGILEVAVPALPAITDSKGCVAACLAALSVASLTSPFAAEALPLLPPQPGLAKSVTAAQSPLASTSTALQSTQRTGGSTGPASSPSTAGTSGGAASTAAIGWERSNAFEAALHSGEWTPAHARVTPAGILALQKAFSEVVSGTAGSRAAAGAPQPASSSDSLSPTNGSSSGRRPSFAGLMHGGAVGPAGLAAMMMAPANSSGGNGDDTGAIAAATAAAAGNLDQCVAQLREVFVRAASSSSSSSSIGNGWLSASTAMLRPLVRAYAYHPNRSGAREGSNAAGNSASSRPNSTGRGGGGNSSRPSSRAAPSGPVGGGRFEWSSSNRRRFLLSLLLARLRRSPSLAQLLVSLHHAMEKDADEDGYLTQREWEGVRMPFEVGHAYAGEVVASFGRAWGDYESDKRKRSVSAAVAAKGAGSSSSASAAAAAAAAANAMLMATGQALTAPSMARMLNSVVDASTTADTHLRETLAVAGTEARSAEASALKGLLFSLFATHAHAQSPTSGGGDYQPQQQQQQPRIDYIAALLHLCADPRSPMSLFGGQQGQHSSHGHTSSQHGHGHSHGHHHQHYSSPYRPQHEYQVPHQHQHGSSSSSAGASSYPVAPPSPSSAASMAALPSMAEAAKADPIARAVIMTATAAAIATGSSSAGNGAGSSSSGGSGEAACICVAGSHPPVASSTSGGSESANGSAGNSVHALSTALAVAAAASSPGSGSNNCMGLRSVGVLKAASLAHIHGLLVAARDAEKAKKLQLSLASPNGSSKPQHKKRETPLSERLAAAAPAIAAFYDQVSASTPTDAKLSRAALQLLHKTFVGGVGIRGGAAAAAAQQDASPGQSTASSASKLALTVGQLLAVAPAGSSMGPSASAEDEVVPASMSAVSGVELPSLVAALHSYLVLPCSPLLLARHASPELLLSSGSRSSAGPSSPTHHHHHHGSQQQQQGRTITR